MLISMKARVYRYTGIYLAEKDEERYVKSQQYWNDYKNIKITYKRMYTPNEYKELLLNAWNFDNGFIRPLTKYEKSIQQNTAMSIGTKIKHHIEMIKLAFLMDMIHLYNSVLDYVNRSFTHNENK